MERTALLGQGWEHQEEPLPQGSGQAAGRRGWSKSSQELLPLLTTGAVLRPRTIRSRTSLVACSWLVPRNWAARVCVGRPG